MKRYGNYNALAIPVSHPSGIEDEPFVLNLVGRGHPSVLAASTDELIEAGWGDYERHAIPADWKTRRGIPRGGPRG